MKEDFVSYEIAKKLKEKGFEWCRVTTYNPKTKVRNNHTEPTISQVLKWLREEKQIHISTTLYSGEENKWNHAIIDVETYKLLNLVMEDNYVTCEASDIAGIEYVIDNLI